ncbi:28038_t:CDS:2 [Gigaspora margarita]|uniref:28038_t:CDS:1 n=1 Tax=Gigaspora margarita TaxID=4874 RepID=A0ABN7VS50_GIGMA|nr:28038_t:CDS:2 [Gigaspora margarita]
MNSSKLLNSNEIDEYKRDISPSATTRRLYNPHRDPTVITSKVKKEPDSQQEFTSSRRASTSSRKLYNPYAEDELAWDDIPYESKSKRELAKKDTEVKLKSSNNHRTKRANSSTVDDFKQPEVTPCKDANNIETAKSIKLLFAKIVAMEKQLSENSNKFSIDIKNLDETASLFQDESYWQIKINSHLRLAKKYYEYIHLSYSSAMKHDIETKCWKIAFYTLIEQFRQAISLERHQPSNKSSPLSSSNVTLNQFNIFLDEAETFYKKLLKLISEDSKHSNKNSESNKPPRWIRCIGCLGDIARYRWTYCLDDQENNKKFWAENASRWYRLGILLKSNNGKLYNHLAILAGQDEFKMLYYYCRSLMVNTPYMAAREPLIWLFESNRKRFASLVTNNNKPKQRGRAYSQRENLQSSNKRCDNLNDHSIESLYIRLHGMLFTKVGLEFFDQTLEVFMDKLFRSKNNQTSNNTNGSHWLEFCLQMVVINISSLYNYGNTENSSLRSTTVTDGDLKQTLDLDPTFAEESKLTFGVMYQFMSKYLDSISSQGEFDISEGFLLYCEIVLLWMVANDAFNNSADEPNNFIWRKFLDKSICPNFWETLARFLTKIAHQVSPFTIKEIIEFSSNIEDSNHVERLRPPPLTEDWELRGTSWLQSLYEPYLFKHVSKPSIKFVDDDIEIITNNFHDNLDLNSGQDAKTRRRARIMELGYLLTKKIVGLDFDIEDTTFTSSLELVDEISDKENERPSASKLLTEEDETSPVITKCVDNGYISDHLESEDEGIMELKSRRQELGNLLAATRESFRGPSVQKFSSKNSKKNTPHATKKVSTLPSRIVAGYTTIVIDTNCLVGDLNMVKKIIQSDNWVVVIPLVVITELDGLKLNPPPLGTAASEAIKFLEQALSPSNRMKKLKVQTSKGNYVSGISFSEEFDFGDGEDKKKNLDDLILGICLWHAKNHAESSFNNHSEKESNNKEVVVLLTNDRNLRVKARARGVDVVSFQDFNELI